MGTRCHIYLIRTSYTFDYNGGFRNKSIQFKSVQWKSAWLVSKVKCGAGVASDFLCPHNEGSFLRNEGHRWESTGKRWRNGDRDKETQTLCLNKISSLESHSYTNSSILGWFKQSLNVGFMIWAARNLTNTRSTSAVRSQWQARALVDLRREKDASFSLFRFRGHGNICTPLGPGEGVGGGGNTSIPYLYADVRDFFTERIVSPNQR